jgi:hypothetical protein
MFPQQIAQANHEGKIFPLEIDGEREQLSQVRFCV